jgi:hypothetical protein
VIRSGEELNDDRPYLAVALVCDQWCRHRFAVSHHLPGAILPAARAIDESKMSLYAGYDDRPYSTSLVLHEVCITHVTRAITAHKQMDGSFFSGA